MKEIYNIKVEEEIRIKVQEHKKNQGLRRDMKYQGLSGDKGSRSRKRKDQEEMHDYRRLSLKKQGSSREKKPSFKKR